MSTPTKTDVQQLKSIRDDLRQQFKRIDQRREECQCAIKQGFKLPAIHSDLRRAKRQIERLVPQITSITIVIDHLESQIK